MIKYFMPTKIYWGKDSLFKGGKDLAEIGKKAFIVTGRGSALISGALPDLHRLMKEYAIKYFHFAEIEENPELQAIHRGADLFKSNNCDYLIGIGGGSPLDAAKAISVIVANNLQNREIYEAAKIKKAYPVVAMPTTSGTGTEVTPYSVVTDKMLNKKAGFGNPLIFPVISFCNPEYTYSLPEKVTVDTALDALSHLLEGIYSLKRCDLLFPLISDGIGKIIDTLEKAIDDPINYDSREKLMTASLYGGMVIAQSGTTLQHSIGYPLTTHYGLSHGMANGVVMKSIMELFYPTVKDELQMLFQRIGISQEGFYNWLDKWVPKTEITLSDDFIEHSATEIAGSRNMAQNPKEVSLEEIKIILKSL